MRTPPFVQKLFRNIFVRNLLIFAGVCLLLYAVAFVGLRIYTHHGEALPVPNVTGLSLSEASAVLEQHKMRAQLSDSVYVANVKPGAVVSQNPEAGFTVKENRNIFLVINAITPAKVEMIDVVGLSLRAATERLESQGLTVGRLAYIPDIARNYVLRQKYRGRPISKGVKVLKGAAIDLDLGTGN